MWKLVKNIKKYNFIYYYILIYIMTTSISVQETTRDLVKEDKKDRTYNSFILILLQRNRIIKKIISKDNRLREALKRDYPELFIDPEQLY